MPEFPAKSVHENVNGRGLIPAGFEIGYEFDIQVMGNSSIIFRLNDQNCMAQMNCGAYEGVKECPNPRTVDLSGMDPPATFDQPPINAIGGATYYPQWAYFDVKSVTEM